MMSQPCDRRPANARARPRTTILVKEGLVQTMPGRGTTIE
jgi:hypothetical protein